MRTSLFAIIVVAIFLRFWQLGTVPPSPDWDEASLGYNAYSILTTGKDEYGKTLPFVLRSFDDYKPALYTYLAIPSIKLFGLTSFAVRLPSAIFGVLTVFATYFLVKELFGKKAEYIALLSSFLLSISPWHLQFSRIAFEANVGLAFNIFAALFFLKGLAKPWLLLFAAMLMGLNLYVYQSEKVFTPLLLLALIIAFRRKLLSLPRKYIFMSAIVGILISIPMTHFVLTNKEALARAQGVSVFSDQTEFLKKNVQKLAQDRQNQDILGIIIDNRRFVYARSLVSGYLAHFDLNWLFLRGDLARHHAPNMGLLYLWELPFLLAGIYFLIFGGFDNKVKAIIFAWFLFAPIPASITSGVPHAIRTLNFLPMFQVFTAIGILFALQKISNIHIKYLIFTLYFSFFIFNFLYYLNQYFVQQNYFFSKDWQYGYQEAVSLVKQLDSRYKRIIVSNTPHMEQSYMFSLFYLQYPPDLYHQEAKGASGGFREPHKFGKFEFRPIEWEKEIKTRDTLFLGRIDDFPAVHAGHVKTIYFLDNTPAIKLVEGE